MVKLHIIIFHYIGIGGVKLNGRKHLVLLYRAV